MGSTLLRTQSSGRQWSAAVLIREALLDHKLVGICDSECEVCVCVCSHVQIEPLVCEQGIVKGVLTILT